MTQNTITINYLTPILHIGLWGLVFLWPLLVIQDVSDLNRIVIRNWLPTFCILLVFYANYWLLVDHFFFKNKKALFFILNVLLIITFFFLIKFITPYFNIEHPGLNIGRVRKMNRNSITSLQLIFPMVLSIGMCLGIKINKQWNKRELEIEKTKQSQLFLQNKYLRYQIQPHFLFNTLNSIYSLTSKKSNDAPEVVLTLSDMMRYMLYYTDGEYVLLKDELKYIENYMKLQRLRIANNQNVKINIHGSVTSQKIRPFLFISFIENAFKYGTDFKGNTEIKINIHVNENELQFECGNIIGNRKKDEESSGIGLNNTKERLQLLYPERHWLHIKEEDNKFVVNLTLKLD